MAESWPAVFLTHRKRPAQEWPAQLESGRGGLQGQGSLKAILVPALTLPRFVCSYPCPDAVRRSSPEGQLVLWVCWGETMLGRKRRKSKPGKTKEREREGKDQSGGFPLKDLSWQAMLKMGKNDAFRFSSQKKWGWHVSWSVSTSNLGRSVKPKRGPARVSRFFPHPHHRAR